MKPRYRLRKGQKVEIWDTKKKKCLGIGTYLESVEMEIFGRTVQMPYFKLGRKKVGGYECYWIPVSEIKKLKNGVPPKPEAANECNEKRQD